MGYRTRTACYLTIALLLMIIPARALLAVEKLIIYTVNYPLAYFAERLTGDLAEVRFPTPPDLDPAFWVPDTDTINAYQSADLILLNGAGYAKWVNRVSLPRSRLVDTSRSFANQYIQAPTSITHSHGPGGEHSHGGTAFTTWLDLTQAAQQAEAVAQAVIRKRPAARDGVTQDLKVLKDELRALDEELAKIGATDPGRPLLASHPVYQYLARRYGLNLRSVHWEPETVPSKQQWGELERILKEHPAAWMLWEAEPADESIAHLRSLGVESVVFNPCANRPATGDFLKVMKDNARNLGKAFEQRSGKP